jgi:flagellar capping protein FliD
MGDIRTALTNLVTLQEGLSITAPVSSSIKRAYKYTPPMSSALPDTPCFLNTWSLTNQELDVSLRVLSYTIRMQLIVHDSDQDQAADIASSYMNAIITAQNADVTLNGSVTQCELRGSDPTLGVLNWAGVDYIGLDLLLDVTISDAVATS